MEYEENLPVPEKINMRRVSNFRLEVNFAQETYTYRFKMYEPLSCVVDQGDLQDYQRGEGRFQEIRQEQRWKSQQERTRQNDVQVVN